jgi:hypothetical protein
MMNKLNTLVFKLAIALGILTLVHQRAQAAQQ